MTVAVGAAAIASGCSTNSSGYDFLDGGCPAELPTSGAPCQPTSSGPCYYGTTCGAPYAYCQQGTWNVGPSACNPPAPAYEAGPDVSVDGFGAYDAGPDGQDQDGGHVTDATGDVASDAESE